MKRIKFIKNVKGYRAGDVAYVTPNEAHGFIDAGYATVSKDMVESDMHSKVPPKSLKTPRKARNEADSHE